MCSRAAVHRLRSFVIDCLTIIPISAKLKDKTTSQTVNDRLHTRLGTLGSLSHNFKSSSECTKAAFALLIGLLNDWAPFSRNAIFKLARETVSQKNKPLLTRVGYPLTTEQVSGRGFSPGFQVFYKLWMATLFDKRYLSCVIKGVFIFFA